MVEDKIDQNIPKVNERPENYFNYMSMLFDNNKYIPIVKTKLKKMGLSFYL